MRRTKNKTLKRIHFFLITLQFHFQNDKTKVSQKFEIGTVPTTRRDSLRRERMFFQRKKEK